MKKEKLNCLKNLESVKKEEKKQQYLLHTAIILLCGGYLYGKLPKKIKDFETLNVQTQIYHLQSILAVLEETTDYYKKEIKKWEKENFR